MADSPAVAQPIFFLAPGEKKNFQIDYKQVLDEGELLTGTPVVTVIAPAAPTLVVENEAVSTVVETVLGKSRAAGQVLKGTLSAAAASTSYVCKVVVGTTSVTNPSLTNYFYVNGLAEPTEVEASAAVVAAHLDIPSVASLSTVDQLKHCRDNIILRIAEITEQVKPDYTSTIAGGSTKSVQWSSYLDSLNRSLLAMNRQVSAFELYEVHTTGYS